MKEALELEKFSDADEIFITKHDRENEMGKGIREETTDKPRISHGDSPNKNDPERRQDFDLQHNYMTSFQFSVLQYEQGR